MKKTHRVGGMWASLFAFFIFFRVLSSCSLLFLVCYGVRGRGKAMALQRNVVYTVTRWMDEWMDWWMDGWMMLKITDSHEQGLEQQLDACLITVFIVLFFWFKSLVRKKTFVMFFLSSCTGEKEGLHQKPLQTWRQSGTVLSLFSFISIETPPPFSSTAFSVKQLQSCWYETKSSSSWFFIRLQTLRRKRRRKNNEMMSEWKLPFWLYFARIC